MTSPLDLRGRGKNDVPIALHAAPGDSVGVRPVQRFAERTQPELSVIGDLPLGVVVVKEKSQAWAFAALAIPQHRQVTVRIAERQDRPPADVQRDVFRLRLAIIEAIEFSKLHQPRAVLVHFEPQLVARADDLLARDAIDLLRARAHEIDATAPHDVGLEALLSQELEQLELRLEGALLEQPPELWMLRLRQPVSRDGVELLLPHARMRGKHQLKKCLLAKTHQRLEVQLEQRLERLALLHCRIPAGELLDPIYEKKDLHVQRLLAPERAVVIEDGDAFCRRHEVWSTLLRHARDEVEDL